MNTNYKLIIEPNSIKRNYFLDLWRYRELFLFLSWKDFLIRYKQTVLGILWSVIRPFLTMIVFTIIFGKLAKLPSEGVPYAILVYTGLLPWQFFANSLTESSNSLVTNTNLVSKIYFPRLIIPASSILVSLADFIISFILLIFILIYYQFTPSLNILLLPLFLLHTLITAYSVGILFAALNVKFRDFRYIIPFFVQFGLFISPVGFSGNIIPEEWKLLYSLNPMVGVIDGFRWAIIGGKYTIYWEGYLLSIVLSISLLFVAVRYFRATEKKFADII